MTEKNKFIESSYHKFKNAITAINNTAIKDIYAVSFWYFEDDDDLRFPTILVSYNTNYKEQILKASSNKEAKWNFAFWLQDFIEQIGGEDDEPLKKWFKKTPYYYSEEESIEAFEADNDETFEKFLKRGGGFCDEFLEEIISMTKRLFSEKIIWNKFEKNIPILIHRLEYSDESTNLTLDSNPKGIADEFIEWVKKYR